MVKEFKELESYRHFAVKSEVHKAVNSLTGILEGIHFDNVVKTAEIEEVLNWCNLHRVFKDKYPFSEIIPMVDKALEDGILTDDEINDIQWLCLNITEDERFVSYYDLVTSSLQKLQGILHGIMADNILHDDEVNSLSEWMELHEFLRGFYPYDEIYSLLTAAKQDGILTNDEINMLKAFFGNFIDTKSSYNVNLDELKVLQEQYSIGGICAVCPDIEVKGKVFSFTGTSSKATRNEIAKIIEENDGIFSKNVTNKTDYLIVGNEGNPCWAFSCYGRKVEKAIDLRKEGHQILIIHENDFWDELY